MTSETDDQGDTTMADAPATPELPSGEGDGEEETGQELTEMGSGSGGPASSENDKENDPEAKKETDKKDGDESDDEPVEKEYIPIEPVDDSQLAKVDLVEKPETADEEARIIKALDGDGRYKLKTGEVWYVIQVTWWKEWCAYAKYNQYQSFLRHNTPPPSEINNSKLCEPQEGDMPLRVKRALMENYDYVLLNRPVWLQLQQWYGGGPELPRRVVETGMYTKVASVEIRPLIVRCFKSSDTETVLKFVCSKSDTIAKTRARMSRAFGLKPKNVQLWDYHGDRKYKLLDKDDLNLDSQQILDNQALLLQEKVDGEFPKTDSGRSGGGYNYYNYNENATYGSATDPGTVGLQNLGNTCFMNSALQCLSHTPPIVRYFNSGAYKDDINSVNPLGLKGKLAVEYADLLQLLWSGNHNSCSPRLFKAKMETFATQFRGYEQHDSQELLQYLSDGLHEDLNRVTVKPYRELPDAEGRPDEDVGNDEWQYHKDRNDSAIFDQFMGQLKSRLHCPKCNRVAVKFDPAQMLTLPLPTKTTRKILCRLVPPNGAKISMEYGVTVKQYATIRAFKQKLSELSGVPVDSLICCTTEGGKFNAVFTDRDTVEPIRPSTIVYAYVVEPNPVVEESKKPSKPVEKKAKADENDAGEPDTKTKEEPEPVVLPPWRHIPLYQRKDESNTWHSYYKTVKTFGLPNMLSIQRDKQYTYRELVEMIFKAMTRFFRTETLEDVFTWTPNKDEGPPHTSSGDEDVDVDVDSRSNSADGEDDGRPPIPDRSTKPRLRPFDLLGADEWGTKDISFFPEQDDEPFYISEKLESIIVHWSKAGFEGPNKLYDGSGVNEHDEHPSATEQEAKLDSRISLQKCFEMFVEEEQLGADDMWYCSRCQDHVQATKQFELWRVPPYLMIHLKRFSGQPMSMWSRREKLDTLVDFPVTDLDLTPFVHRREGEPAPIYDLYAVSNHFGGMGGGHYTAFARNHVSGKWYNFDDSHVTEISEQNVVGSAAYILLYRRRDTFENDKLPNNDRSEWPAKVGASSSTETN